MDFTDHITPEHEAMIARQAVYFVATAAADARINLSPKGLDGTFKVLGPNRVAYLDLGGSGNETHAHLAADGRITIMMCNFSPLSCAGPRIAAISFGGIRACLFPRRCWRVNPRTPRPWAFPMPHS